MKKSNRNFLFLRRFSLLAAVLILISSLAACSASSFNKASDNEIASNTGASPSPQESPRGDYYSEADNGYTAEKGSISASPPAAGGDIAGGNVTDTRKIVKTVGLELETKSFNDAVAKITASATSAGGYIEYSYISGESLNNSSSARKASFSVRVPAAGLDSYVGGFTGIFNLLSKTENSSDITDIYYDAEARLKSLQTQEERLLAMLEGATELQYMLQVEQTLADVRYQIESYYSTIKRYDSQVELSTVTINLYEVIDYKVVTELPKTFGERLWQALTDSWSGFVDSFKDFAVGFIYAFPTLLVLAVIITAVVLIIKARIRRRRRVKAASQEQAPKQ